MVPQSPVKSLRKKSLFFPPWSVFLSYGYWLVTSGICAQTQGRDRKCYFYVSNKQMLRLKKIFYNGCNPKTAKEELEELLPGWGSSCSMRTSFRSILDHTSDTIHNPGEFIKPRSLDLQQDPFVHFLGSVHDFNHATPFSAVYVVSFAIQLPFWKDWRKHYQFFFPSPYSLSPCTKKWKQKSIFKRDSCSQPISPKYFCSLVRSGVVTVRGKVCCAKVSVAAAGVSGIAITVLLLHLPVVPYRRYNACYTFLMGKKQKQLLSLLAGELEGFVLGLSIGWYLSLKSQCHMPKKPCLSVITCSSIGSLAFSPFHSPWQRLFSEPHTCFTFVVLLNFVV